MDNTDEVLKDYGLKIISWGLRILKTSGYEIDDGIPKEWFQKELSKYAKVCDEIAESLSTEEYEVHRQSLKQGIDLALQSRDKIIAEKAAELSRANDHFASVLADKDSRIDEVIASKNRKVLDLTTLLNEMGEAIKSIQVNADELENGKPPDSLTGPMLRGILTDASEALTKYRAWKGEK